ncbi:MAG: DUF1343 domain-containing protein [Chitinophagaceae bacterium]|nr:MAG: DUF1343 domain-containing protein [Chitinophagaceae bacterium]
MPIQFGIDHLLQQSPDWKNKSIGILTNQAATTSNGIPSRKALIDNGFNIVLLFSPEHGLDAAGTDGAKMNDGIDTLTGLKVISLYGEKFKPSKEDLSQIDIMLFDIPDAGTRFYTYLWSMTYWIEAAAENQIPVYILDRPNPLGGLMTQAEGPLLDEALSSFIGRFNIPIKHQCTLGELALYFNKTQHWNANLHVITCNQWKREQLFYEWNLPWVKPSPALQNIEACILYPGLCFFEATNISVGRGTKYSFEWLGAHWLNLPAIAMVGQNLLRLEMKIETLTLKLPTTLGEEETKGFRIKIIDPTSYSAVMNGLLLLKLLKDLHPHDFKWMPYPTQANPTGENHLSLLLGIPNAELIFDLPLQAWLQQITKWLKISQWPQEINEFLLY